MTPDAQILPSRALPGAKPRAEAGADRPQTDQAGGAGFEEAWAAAEDRQATPEDAAPGALVVAAAPALVPPEVTPESGGAAAEQPRMAATAAPLQGGEAGAPSAVSAQTGGPVTGTSGPTADGSDIAVAATGAELRPAQAAQRLETGKPQAASQATSQAADPAPADAAPVGTVAQTSPGELTQKTAPQAPPFSAAAQEPARAQAQPQAQQAVQTAPLPQKPAAQKPGPQTELAGDLSVPDVEPAQQDLAPRAMDGLRAEAARADPTRADVARADTARHVSHQIVEVIRQGPDGSIDVSLNPEELGRVRLTLSGGEASLQVMIQSDRPETADLLRRHIAQLQQDFHDLGYTQVSIDFGQSPGHAPGRNRMAAAGTAADDLTAEAAIPAAQRPAAARPTPGSAGLDLRL